MGGRLPNSGNVVPLRGDAPRHETRPSPLGPLGEPPAGLSAPWLAVALEKWRELASPEVWGAVLHASDRDLLERYCIQWARFMRARQEIEQHGVLVAAPNGFPCQSPWVKEQNEAENNMRQIAKVIERRLQGYVGRAANGQEDLFDGF